MKYFLFFFSVFLCAISFSQNNCKPAYRKLKKIEKHISKGKSEKALELLSTIKFACSDPSFASAIGDIYFYCKDMTQAQSFYLKSYKISGLNYINSISLSILSESSF